MLYLRGLLSCRLFMMLLLLLFLSTIFIIFSVEESGLFGRSWLLLSLAVCDKRFLSSHSCDKTDCAIW
jgi:hypothetical protein